jgi:hypothetical protein
MIPDVKLPTGKIVDLPNEEYHAAPAISHSKLEDFRSRASYYHAKYIDKRVAKEDTEDLLVGHSAHTLVLEGACAYEDRYAVEPADAPRRPTKAQVNAKKPSEETLKTIEFWKAWDEENKGACVLTSGIERLNRSIAGSVRKNAVAAALLTDPGFVPEITWRLRLRNGLYLQCRTDGWIESVAKATSDALKAANLNVEPGESLALDFKTCESLTKGEFGAFDKAIVNYGYHRQQAFYTPIVQAVRGKVVDHFIFIAAEKQEPFETGVYRLDGDALKVGADENAENLQALIQCYKSDDWPGIPQNVVMKISLPEWYLRRAENNYAA